jgi:hypothetical protein
VYQPQLIGELETYHECDIEDLRFSWHQIIDPRCLTDEVLQNESNG